MTTKPFSAEANGLWTLLCEGPLYDVNPPSTADAEVEELIRRELERVAARSRPADPDPAPDVEALVDALAAAAFREGVSECNRHLHSTDSIKAIRDAADAARAALLDHVRSIRRRAIEEAAKVGYRMATDVESGMRINAAIRALAAKDGRTSNG